MFLFAHLYGLGTRLGFRVEGLGLSKFVRVWGLVEDFPKKSKKWYPRRRSTAL